MQRLTAAELIRRYGAGERDFRRLDLRGLNLSRQQLAGADFSGADLRSTDFLEANLQGVNFADAIGGLRRRNGLIQGLFLFVAGGLSGGLNFFMLFILYVSLYSDSGSMRSSLGLWPSILAGVIEFTLLFVVVWEGFSVKFIFVILAFAVAGAVAAAFAFAAAGAAAFAGAFAAAAAVVAAVAGAVAVAATITFAITFAAAGAMAVAAVAVAASAVAAAFVAAVVVVVAAGWVAAGWDAAIAITFAAAFILLLGFAYWRASRGAPGYAGAKKFGVELAAIGGTRFEGADLRGAFFRQARLANTSFAASRRQPTRLERVCFSGAWGLERARLGTSLLADPRVRQLLVTLQGAKGQFEAINLRGAWLEQVDLRGANLRYADLSGAALGQAQLQQANLKACQCLGTDFSAAELDGACLEGWNIDSGTNLAAVQASHVYLLECTDQWDHRRDDHQRERLPHDPKKNFEAGDFETYFQQVLEEVKILIRGGINPKAFQQAFQEVMRQQPQITPECLTSIRRSPSRQDVMATFQVPQGTDKAAFQHTLDSEYRALDSKYRALELENVRLQGQLAGESRLAELERRRAEEHHSLTLQTLNLVKALAPVTGNPQPPQITNYINNEPNRTMTGNHNEIHTGNGGFVNTGNFQPQGSAINLGSLSDQARISIEALSEARPAADQPSLRELLSELKRQIDNDPQLPDIAKADALTEVQQLAAAAQDPSANASLARRSINVLRGLGATVSQTTKLANETTGLLSAVQKLLPLIAGFFL